MTSAPASATLHNLYRTIDQGLVSIVFQPIVGLEQAGIIAYEALTRPSPESGFAYPDQLFDAAEQHDLIWELECVTRRAALEAASTWPDGNRLFLNATPQVIADDRFAETILAELAEIDGLTPARIVLEVTERSENRYVEGLQRQTAMLQQHGFSIAIDDVGAGTSGLNRIMLLRPQWLKIDRALITDIDRDPVRTNLIRFLTHFARLSGVSIVAEGIERVEELDRLIQLGVDTVQGYLLGRPGSADQVLDPKIAARITANSSARGGVFDRDHSETLASLAPRTLCADGAQDAAPIAEELRADTNIVGVIVDAHAPQPGWCPRAALVDGDFADGTPLARLAVPFVRSLNAADRIDVALEIAGSIEPAHLETPFALVEEARTVGVVRVRDLLRAGAEVCRVVRQRSATLTGLPGRVRCEQQLLRAFGSPTGKDVVFVDICNLGEYNAVFGFDLGDQLITNLVEVIEDAVGKCAGDCVDAAFLGHLGDDRLMLITDAGVARRIARPAIERFESRVMATGISPQVALSGVGTAPAIAGVALRYLIVPDIAAGFETPQSVLQIEPVLRAMSNEQAALDPTRAGYIVEAQRDDESESYMLAA